MSYWRYSKKEEADYLKSLSVFFLNKNGYFNPGWRSGTVTWSRNGMQTGNINIEVNVTSWEQHVRFLYTQTDRGSDQKTEFDYQVSLVTTACRFGGVRYWFKCPCSANGVYCGRRVGVLYLGNKYFACRHCHNLTYNSCNLSGISKSVGQVISMPELQRLENEIKRKYYRGKKTKKYQRLLRKEWKSEQQLLAMEGSLYRKS